VETEEGGEGWVSRGQELNRRKIRRQGFLTVILAVKRQGWCIDGNEMERRGGKKRKGDKKVIKGEGKKTSHRGGEKKRRVYPYQKKATLLDRTEGRKASRKSKRQEGKKTKKKKSNIGWLKDAWDSEIERREIHELVETEKRGAEKRQSAGGSKKKRSSRRDEITLRGQERGERGGDAKSEKSCEWAAQRGGGDRKRDENDRA